MLEQLTAETVIDYVRNRIEFFKPNERLFAKELSDGNINYVYRVQSEESGASVVVKQATDTLRSDSSRSLTHDRMIFEVNALKKMQSVNPGAVPEIYLFDEEQKCCVMEDCRDYEIMRAGLMRFKTYEGFAKSMAEFLARQHFFTGDFYLSGAEKKRQVMSFVNPQLCEITERLVYSEPFTDYLGRNTVLPELRETVEKGVYGCEELRLAAAKRKLEFMSSAQAMLHGDLHTGSIFINDASFKVFDTEFAFYGPCGYDLGCLVGNILFAYAAAHALGGRGDFEAWALSCCELLLSEYARIFVELSRENTKDVMLRTQGMAEAFAQSVLESAVATAGIELLRRTIARSKVADITELPTHEHKVLAQRCCIALGRDMLLRPEGYCRDFPRACRAAAQQK